MDRDAGSIQSTDVDIGEKQEQIRIAIEREMEERGPRFEIGDERAEDGDGRGRCMLFLA